MIMVGGQLIGLIPFFFLLFVLAANWQTIRSKQMDLTAGQVISVILAYIAAIGTAYLLVRFAGNALIKALPIENVFAVSIIEFLIIMAAVYGVSAILSIITIRITHDSR